MPSESEYKGYLFWHPRKLIWRKSENGYLMSFSYTDDFIFTLIKSRKGKQGKWEIAEKTEISPSRMEAAYGLK